MTHTLTTENLCKSLDIQMLRRPNMPSKSENVIEGSSLKTGIGAMEKLREFCNNRIEEFPALKTLIAEENIRSTAYDLQLNLLPRQYKPCCPAKLATPRLVKFLDKIKMSDLKAISSQNKSRHHSGCTFNS